jgi:hypothetical protein
MTGDCLSPGGNELTVGSLRQTTLGCPESRHISVRSLDSDSTRESRHSGRTELAFIWSRRRVLAFGAVGVEGFEGVVFEDFLADLNPEFSFGRRKSGEILPRTEDRRRDDWGGATWRRFASHNILVIDVKKGLQGTIGCCCPTWSGGVCKRFL